MKAYLLKCKLGYAGPRKGVVYLCYGESVTAEMMAEVSRNTGYEYTAEEVPGLDITEAGPA